MTKTNHQGKLSEGKEMNGTITENRIRNHLIENGVKNLRQFGYSSVNEENILTDYMYAMFFKNMLKENKGVDTSVDAEIDALLNEINNER